MSLFTGITEHFLFANVRIQTPTGVKKTFFFFNQVTTKFTDFGFQAQLDRSQKMVIIPLISLKISFKNLV